MRAERRFWEGFELPRKGFCSVRVCLCLLSPFFIVGVCFVLLKWNHKCIRRVCMFMYLYISVYLTICLSPCLYNFMYIYMFPFIYLSIYLLISGEVTWGNKSFLVLLFMKMKWCRKIIDYWKEPVVTFQNNYLCVLLIIYFFLYLDFSSQLSIPFCKVMLALVHNQSLERFWCQGRASFGKALKMGGLSLFLLTSSFHIM